MHDVEQPSTTPRTGDTFPIVLACGFARFDRIELRRCSDDNVADDNHYFKRIRSTLNRAGFNAHHTTVDFGAPVAKRAGQLLAQVEEVRKRTGAPKVHIIAHSMGGLDARWMVAELGGDEAVCSLTTIGTPHHGSPVADWCVGRASLARSESSNTERRGLASSVEVKSARPPPNGSSTDEKKASKRSVLLKGLLAAGIDFTGIYDLTETATMAMNARLEPKEADNGVVYRAWAGIIPPWRVSWPFRTSALLLKYKVNERGSDGLVPAHSARWNERRYAGTLPWDHLCQLGWWSPSRLAALDLIPSRFERRVCNFYLQLAERLKEHQRD